MRPHGRAEISARAPRALGVCQRCGFLWNLDRLSWQYDWQQGPRLMNLRIQVCPDCYDKPQESGRTLHLPPDPVGVAHALPEIYALADNPVSVLGYNSRNRFLPLVSQSFSGNIGNLTQNAGVDAAFDGVTQKHAPLCAARAISNSGFNNWVGKNWGADTSGITLTTPSSVVPLTHNVSSFTVTAPIDAPFLRTGATGYTFDVSADGVNWTTVLSGTTAGTIGEVLTTTQTANTGSFQYHRVNFQGNAFAAIAVAQVVFNISDAAVNDI